MRRHTKHHRFALAPAASADEVARDKHANHDQHEREFRERAGDEPKPGAEAHACRGRELAARDHFTDNGTHEHRAAGRTVPITPTMISAIASTHHQIGSTFGPPAVGLAGLSLSAHDVSVGVEHLHVT